MRELLETAFLQKGLPLISTVEAEGQELQLSLISEGVGLGFVMPAVQCVQDAVKQQLRIH